MDELLGDGVGGEGGGVNRGVWEVSEEDYEEGDGGVGGGQ